jgi:hypothetical protein
MNRSKTCIPTDEMQAFLDGALSSAENLRIHAHVKECPLCKKEMEAFQNVFCRVTSLGNPEPLDEPTTQQVSRLMKRIQTVEPGSAVNTSLVPFWPTLVSGWRLPMAIAFGVLIVLVTGLHLRSRPHPVDVGSSPSPQHVNEVSGFEYVAFVPRGATITSRDEPRVPLPEKGTITIEKTVLLPEHGKLVVQHGLNRRLELTQKARFSLLPTGIFLESGRVHCSLSGPPGVFIVQSPHGSVTALGTVFQVDVDPLRTRIILSKGRLGLSTKHHQDLMEGPGSSILERSGEIRVGAAHDASFPRNQPAPPGDPSSPGFQGSSGDPVPGIGTGSSAQSINQAF